jgi:hypothetical protein
MKRPTLILTALVSVAVFVALFFTFFSTSLNKEDSAVAIHEPLPVIVEPEIITTQPEEAAPAAEDQAEESAPPAESARNGGGATMEREETTRSREHLVLGSAAPSASMPAPRTPSARQPAMANGHEEMARRMPENGGPTNNGGMPRTYDEWLVKLGADSELKIPGAPGELKVWIGVPEFVPDFPERMETATDTLPAVGATAKVEPFAPGFDVKPNESVCMRIHPRGSEVRFELIPKDKGVFHVGANVNLYDSDDCTGAPIPKAASSLEVKVVVDQRRVIEEHTKELWEVFWDKLVEFWGAVLALFFGLLLYLLRGKIKRTFGFDAKDED